jgi:hypothetical protein
MDDQMWLLEDGNVASAEKTASETDMSDSSTSSYVRVEQIAEWADLTVMRIQQLTKEGIIQSEKVPYQKGRMYNGPLTLVKLLRYFKKKASAKAEKVNTPIDDAMEAAKLQDLDVKIRERLAKVEIIEGKAHKLETIRRVWSDVIGAFKMQMNNLPHMASDKLVGIADRNEVYEILETEMRRLSALLLDYDTASFFARNADYDDDEVDGDMTEYEEEVETTNRQAAG